MLLNSVQELIRLANISYKSYYKLETIYSDKYLNIDYNFIVSSSDLELKAEKIILKDISSDYFKYFITFDVIDKVFINYYYTFNHIELSIYQDIPEENNSMYLISTDFLQKNFFTKTKHYLLNCKTNKQNFNELNSNSIVNITTAKKEFINVNETIDNYNYDYIGNEFCFIKKNSLYIKNRIDGFDELYTNCLNVFDDNWVNTVFLHNFIVDKSLNINDNAVLPININTNMISKMEAKTYMDNNFALKDWEVPYVIKQDNNTSFLFEQIINVLWNNDNLKTPDEAISVAEAEVIIEKLFDDVFHRLEKGCEYGLLPRSN